MGRFNRLALFIGVLGWALVSCRGKEGPQGPQGPAGQDRTYREQGYVSINAKGVDANTNQPFELQVRYTYTDLYDLSGVAFPITTDSAQYFINRIGGPTLPGYVYLSFYWKPGSNGEVSTNTQGWVCQRSGDTLKSYEFTYAPYSGDTAYLRNVNVQGNTISGQLVYIKRSKTPADTVRADFSSEFIKVQSYQRLAMPSAGQPTQKSE